MTEWLVALPVATAVLVAVLALAADRSERRVERAFDAGKAFACEEFGHRLAADSRRECFCGKKTL